MVTDGNKKAAFFEKWNRLKRLPYLGRTTRKSITIFYHKGDCIAIFCHLKDVFYFADHRAKSDIFQRKNSKLQQILSVFKTLCPPTSAPPLVKSTESGSQSLVPFFFVFYARTINHLHKTENTGCGKHPNPMPTILAFSRPFFSLFLCRVENSSQAQITLKPSKGRGSKE